MAKTRDYKKASTNAICQHRRTSGLSSDHRTSGRRARRMYDKEGIDRKGKDIDHIKVPLSQGTVKSSKGNLRLPGQASALTHSAQRNTRSRTCG
jgi:hypothetical protein